MLEFLMVASFVVHAITLTALYMVFKQMNNQNKSCVNEMDSVMATYLEQIRKENNELQTVLHTYTPQNETNERDSSDEDDQPIDGLDEWNERRISLKSGEDTIETTLKSRVLQLYHDGIPINEIAKQLHCGETEASLIIQFQHKK